MSKGVFAALYETGTPFALIDTRERRDHVDGHWFGSTNIPLSRLRRVISRLVPDPGFPIHLFDWQDSASQAAANALAQLGYHNLTIHPTCRPAEFGDGFVKGEYVWSKAFGEVVAHDVEFPEVTPETYMADHQDAPLFDVRPMAEYRQFTIPGSTSLPNSLLLANMTALRARKQTALLHCAGRTRSIIGACTLKAAGYDGPFAVFRGGTQSWQLAGLEREHGANRSFASESETPDDVRHFLARWKIDWREAHTSQLAHIIADHAGHLVFDVSDDAATGTALIHGVTRISGTNLIQQTDRSIARYHVPVLLLDHGSASRAAFAAFWLSAMGFEVRIIRLDASIPTAAGSAAAGCEQTGPAPLATDQLLDRLRQRQSTLIDLRPSSSFMKRHLAGSSWRNVSVMLNANPDEGPGDGPVTLICEEMTEGSDAAGMLTACGWQVDGLYVWQDAGIPSEALLTGALDSPVDESALFAGRHHGNLQDARDYLAWEEDLPAQIDEVVHDLWRRRIEAALNRGA